MPATKTAARPATKKPATSNRPAAKVAKNGSGNVITLAMLADRLGVSEKGHKGLRQRIRTALPKGETPGKGKRYQWTSWKDPQLLKLIKLLSK